MSDTDDEKTADKGSKSDEEPDASQEDEYHVEKILNKRTVRGKVQYLIKWRGYPESDCTWEPEENCNCYDIIEEFEEKLLKEKSKKKEEGSEKRKTKPKAKSSNAKATVSSTSRKRLLDDDSDKDSEIEKNKKVPGEKSARYVDSDHSSDENDTRMRKSRGQSKQIKLSSDNDADTPATSSKDKNAHVDDDSDESINDIYSKAKESDAKRDRQREKEREKKKKEREREREKDKEKSSNRYDGDSTPKRNGAVEISKSSRSSSWRDADHESDSEEDDEIHPDIIEATSDVVDRGYDVEKILGATSHNGQIFFLVKYKNTLKADLICSNIAKYAFPRVVISYFMNNLVWRD